MTASFRPETKVKILKLINNSFLQTKSFSSDFSASFRCSELSRLESQLWIKVFEGQSSKLLKPKESRRLLLRLVSDAVWTLKNDIKIKCRLFLFYICTTGLRSSVGDVSATCRSSTSRSASATLTVSELMPKRIVCSVRVRLLIRDVSCGRDVLDFRLLRRKSYRFWWRFRFY